MNKTFYLFVISILITTSSFSQKRFDFGKIKNNTYLNNFFELEITFKSNWIVIQNDDIFKNLTMEDEPVKDKNKVKVKNLGRACLLDLRKDSAIYASSLIVSVINKRIDSKVKTIENFLDIIFEKQKFLINKSVHEKKSIGSLEFNRVSFIADPEIFERDLKVEAFVAIKRGFFILIDITYSNEREKKELYEMINRIKI